MGNVDNFEGLEVIIRWVNGVRDGYFGILMSLRDRYYFVM